MTQEVCEHDISIFADCDKCEKRIYPKGTKVHLTKHELLEILRLLSGLESAICYRTDRASVPDYLLDELQACAEILEREILK